jgi:hypothetical protein
MPVKRAEQASEVILFVHFDPELPMFSSEVRYYREILRVSCQFGSHLRTLGALVPDAILDTGGVLFLLTPEKVREAEAQVFLAKTRGFKDQAAEPVSA